MKLPVPHSLVLHTKKDNIKAKDNLTWFVGQPDAQGDIQDLAEQFYSPQLYLERGGAETREAIKNSLIRGDREASERWLRGNSLRTSHFLLLQVDHEVLCP